MSAFLSFLSQPLAIHRPTLMEMVAAFSRRESSSESREPISAASLAACCPTDADLIVADGVALLPIHGPIVKRTQVFHGWYSDKVMVGSDFWAKTVKRLAARTDIDHIILDIDSGGGQVSGTETFANAVFEARQSTNVISVVNEFAASAALWIGAAASRIVIPPTAEIRSLGVYTIHADWSKWLDEVGIKETVIHAGKYKAIHERTLTDELKAHEQHLIDGLYSAFVDNVARFRGVSSEHVLENWAEARCFLGSEAVSNGLADELGTLSDVLESVAAGRSGRVSLPAPVEPEPEDNDDMLTLNADTGAIEKDGKQIGTFSELNISAEILQQHSAEAVKSITDKAVTEATATITEKAAKDALTAVFAQIDGLAESFGDATLSDIAPVIKGDKDAATFRAEQAEAAAAALKAENEKLRLGTRAPGFSSSEKEGKGNAGGDNAAFQAEWDANADGCQDEFACFEDFQAYQTALQKSLVRG
jgi:signal peptide peptidase SppA